MAENTRDEKTVFYICSKCGFKFYLDEISVRARGPTIFEFINYRQDCPFCGHFDVKKPWYRTLEVL